MTQFKGDTISHCHLGGERVVSQLYLKNPSLTDRIRLDFAHYVIASEHEAVKGLGNVCRSKGWLETYDYFYEYVNGVCRFSDLNVYKCRSFCEFMLGEKGLSTRLCYKHFGYFRDILREAYQDGYLLDNICLILNL